MTGVLVNIALTLIVFAFAEAVRARAERSRLLQKAMGRQLAFEAYYRENPPRPFLFYVFYPLLLPYVLARPGTRRELALYRGFTGGGAVILVALAALDFYRHWLPDLGLGEFLTVWVALFFIQTLAIFVFLLPVSTTVVKLHSERRLRALWVLLGVAALSVSLAVVTIVRRPGHVVSWVTSRRVMLRTAAVPDQARAAQLAALRAVRDNYAELVASTDAEGWVEGDAGERAEAELGAFYKPDEAYAFSLHALPPAAPETIILQCWIVGGGEPVWRAVRRDGTEITDRKDIPRGVLGQKPHQQKKAGSGAHAKAVRTTPTPGAPPQRTPPSPKKK
jgi:hypothetical protein